MGQGSDEGYSAAEKEGAMVGHGEVRLCSGQHGKDAFHLSEKGQADERIETEYTAGLLGSADKTKTKQVR